jgi:hypothetical protein
VCATLLRPPPPRNTVLPTRPPRPPRERASVLNRGDPPPLHTPRSSTSSPPSAMAEVATPSTYTSTTATAATAAAAAAREQPCRCKALVTRPSASHLLQKAP